MSNNDYVRDADGMFINTNSDDYERYKQARARAYRDKERDAKIERLEKEIIQIKQLLQNIHSRIQ